MNTYAVLRKTDQVEVHRYEADAPTAGEHPFETHDHIALSYAALETTRITRLSFLNRFTDNEAIGVDLASQGATTQAAAMRRYKDKINATEYVDLQRQETRDGVLTLEAVGLLAAGRAAVILDTYVKVHEMYDRQFLDLPAYSIPEPEVAPTIAGVVYRLPVGVYATVAAGDPAPAEYTASWRVSPLQFTMIQAGASLTVDEQGSLKVEYVEVIEAA